MHKPWLLMNCFEGNRLDGSAHMRATAAATPSCLLPMKLAHLARKGRFWRGWNKHSQLGNDDGDVVLFAAVEHHVEGLRGAQAVRRDPPCAKGGGTLGGMPNTVPVLGLE